MYLKIQMLIMGLIQHTLITMEELLRARLFIQLQLQLETQKLKGTRLDRMAV